MYSKADDLVSIISATPTAIAVVDMDMRYIAASGQWIDDFGLHGKKIIGESHYDLFPEIGEEWKQIHKECLKGKAQKNPQEEFVRLNGDVQWLCWEIRPWMGSEGQISGMVMYSEDITKRVLEEIQLKRNLDLFYETNEAASTGSWEYDIPSDAIFCSPMVRRLFELPSDFVPKMESISSFLKDDSDRKP